MWNGKKKAITFSYDDGVLQDIRLTQIFARYGLHATFNLNSGYLGTQNKLVRNDVEVRHDKVAPADVKAVYDGFEVAAHTKRHPSLPRCTDDDVVAQVEEDRVALSALCGYEVVGLAYPGGGTNYDERVVKLVREHTGVRYARTIESSGTFALPDDFLALHPTVYHIDTDKMFALGEAFLASESEENQLFYVWGHSYEFDAWNFWDRFEAFCRMMAGHDDIFYGSNREVLL